MSQQTSVAHLKAASLMSKTVHCVTLGMTIGEIIQLFLEKKISGAPIVDVDNRVLTVISEADVMKFAALSGLDEVVVRVANKLPAREDVITVHQDATFRDVFKQFLTHNIRRIIVVDAIGKLQGLISRADILRAFNDSKELQQDIHQNFKKP